MSASLICPWSSSGVPDKDLRGLAHGAPEYLDQKELGRVRPYYELVRLHEGVGEALLSCRYDV
jgi:hypothetical protein